MENTIYSIGYSAFSRDDFIKELKKYKVSVLVDVRSSPFSSFHPEYNRDVLEALLKEAQIYYRNYAHEFGARQECTALYASAGYLDFEKVANSSSFQDGVSKLSKSIEQGYVPALMCAEKDPFDCHRAILVSRAFFERGYHVIHILPEDKTCNQDDINDALLKKYFPNRDQFSLFGNEDEATLLNKAYKMRNSEIGYRIEEG